MSPVSPHPLAVRCIQTAAHSSYRGLDLQQLNVPGSDDVVCCQKHKTDSCEIHAKFCSLTLWAERSSSPIRNYESRSKPKYVLCKHINLILATLFTPSKNILILLKCCPYLHIWDAF